jgi:hypothetical protein
MLSIPPYRLGHWQRAQPPTTVVLAGRARQAGWQLGDG